MTDLSETPSEVLERVRDRLAGQAVGLRLSAELEGAVVAHLQPDADKFQARNPDDPADARRVRQRFTSLSQIREWQRDIEAHDVALAAIDAELQRRQKED